MRFSQLKNYSKAVAPDDLPGELFKYEGRHLLDAGRSSFILLGPLASYHNSGRMLTSLPSLDVKATDKSEITGVASPVLSVASQILVHVMLKRLLTHGVDGHCHARLSSCQYYTCCATAAGEIPLTERGSLSCIHRSNEGFWQCQQGPALSDS